MKKICIIIVLILFMFCAVTTACNKKPKASMVQAHRRFAQYTESQQKSNSGYVDLSEGPRQNYDRYLGPQNLNFDIKIVDPY